MFQKSGCLLTGDVSDDNLIQPEDLPNYEVPPPSLLEPTTSAPEVHMLKEVGPQSILDDQIVTIESDAEEDEMLVDFNEDGNIFNLFNNFDI